MAAREFKFPKIYDFPPLFTIQKNEATRSRQLDIWKDLIVEYCSTHRIFEYDLSILERHSASRASDLTNPSERDYQTTDTKKLEAIFFNRRIDRKLNIEESKIVMKHLVGKGCAVWYPKGSQTTGLVLWQSIEGWANNIYKWAQRTGHSDTVCTIYELSSGSDTLGESFHGVDERILTMAAEHLQSIGKAAVLYGESKSEVGVKFC